MSGRLRCVFLAGCLVLAAAGQAQSPPDGRLVRVSSGQEVQLAVLNNTVGECSGLPVPEVRIAKSTAGRGHHHSLWAGQVRAGCAPMRWPGGAGSCSLLPAERWFLRTRRGAHRGWLSRTAEPRTAWSCQGADLYAGRLTVRRDWRACSAGKWPKPPLRTRCRGLQETWVLG
jgi:hypothetical protein